MKKNAFRQVLAIIAPTLGLSPVCGCSSDSRGTTSDLQRNATSASAAIPSPDAASPPAPDPEVVELLRTLGEGASPLHYEYTPSVHRLIELGWPGARAVLDLLDAPEDITRRRAQRVIEGVVMRHHGWRPGVGYLDPSGAEKTGAVVSQNGSYRADAPQAERRASMEKWRTYLAAQNR